MDAIIQVPPPQATELRGQNLWIASLCARVCACMLDKWALLHLQRAAHVKYRSCGLCVRNLSECYGRMKCVKQKIRTSQNQITKVPYLSLKVVRVIVSVLGVHWLLFQTFAHVAGILLAVSGYRDSRVGSNNSKSLRLWFRS